MVKNHVASVVCLKNCCYPGLKRCFWARGDGLWLSYRPAKFLNFANPLVDWLTFVAALNCQSCVSWTYFTQPLAEHGCFTCQKFAGAYSQVSPVASRTGPTTKRAVSKRHRRVLSAFVVFTAEVWGLQQSNDWSSSVMSLRGPPIVTFEFQVVTGNMIPVIRHEMLGARTWHFKVRILV